MTGTVNVSGACSSGGGGYPVVMKEASGDEGGWPTPAVRERWWEGWREFILGYGIQAATQAAGRGACENYM